ncbi:FAD-dependent monooxygenase [Streptomyces sp. AK02-01A]|uniref:FAD-dependent monooxygenase n=1 Tax=Streptomyces sp. AK02-01A TaxID=3028648 RepID=UPI0029A0E088|nr:FAD-dependent monooxygenase [Streptomyces sp. AK02-01A]MDX3854928.1 FAD-dependent monooxygenase [Streptomyces sp. AK02-01A]
MSSPVLIAGGGPTGLMLAGELALAGVRSVVLEKLATPPKESRGMTLHARAIETLQQRGLWDRFPKEDIPEWHRVHFSLFWLDLDDLGEHEYTLLLPQWRTERFLEQRALELGVDIRRGHEVLGFEQDADGVTVRVATASGEEELRGSYLVGCDGGGSTVRKLAGIDFPASGHTYYGVVGDVEIPDGGSDHVAPGLYPAGTFGITVTSPGQHRLTAIEFDGNPPPKGTPVTLDELRGAIRRVIGDEPKIDKVHWLSRFVNTTRLAAHYRADRVFLAGDSAHVHFPATGQGLNVGMQDAMNLGWKLAAEINGWAPDGLLDTYHSERHPVGREVCMNTQAQMALMHPLDRVGPLRELFGELVKFDEVKRYLVNMVTGLSSRYAMDYADRPGDGPEAHPLLGRRVPDAPLETEGDGPATVSRTQHAGRPVVLDLSGGTAELGDLTAWSDRVEVVTAAPTAKIDAAVLVIRPDGHVAWADRTGSDTEGLHLALAAWFGPSTATSGR